MIVNCWQKTEIVPINEWGWPNSDVHSEDNVRPEPDIKELISSIPLNGPVLTAEEYIHIDDSLEIEEVSIDETTIIEQIRPPLDPEDSDDDCDIEVEKISHSTALEKCKSLLQYVEQQDLNFVEELDLLRLWSLLRLIQAKILETRQQKRLTDFF